MVLKQDKIPTIDYYLYMSRFELSMGEPSIVVRSIADRYGVNDLQIKNTVTYVGLADERLVIKAPKSAQSMGSLVVEAAALELLDRSQPFPFAIPQVVEFSTDPVFLVMSYKRHR